MSMNEPNLDDLSKLISSKFSLVTLGLKRARQLKAGARPLVDITDPRDMGEPKEQNPVTIALREILAGQVRLAPMASNEELEREEQEAMLKAIGLVEPASVAGSRRMEELYSREDEEATAYADEDELFIEEEELLGEEEIEDRAEDEIEDEAESPDERMADLDEQVEQLAEEGLAPEIDDEEEEPEFAEGSMPEGFNLDESSVEEVAEAPPVVDDAPVAKKKTTRKKAE
jgi:DNA-directed RNA polymerase omega subunit